MATTCIADDALRYPKTEDIGWLKQKRPTELSKFWRFA